MTDLEPRLAVYAVLGTGKAAHLLRDGLVVDDSHAVAVCGTAGPIAARLEADERAVRVGPVVVCGNCRDQLAFRPSTSIVVVEPTRRRSTRREGAGMATATQDRKKAPSSALIETAQYATTDVERLRAERLTINNRISGLKTQLKRAAGTDKVGELQARLDDLTNRRQMLADQITARAATVDEATFAAIGAIGAPDNAALAAATEDAAAELDAASKPTPKRKSATRRSSTRSTTKRATAKKPKPRAARKPKPKPRTKPKPKPRSATAATRRRSSSPAARRRSPAARRKKS